MVWKPHVTVAAIVEQDGRFLMVEEESGGKVVLNQPAGHLEPDESVIDACVRETLEETGWTIRPESLVGSYLWMQPDSGETMLRFCFRARCERYDPHLSLDEGIIRAVWMTYEELLAQSGALRSPLVLRCIQDARSGKAYPMEMFSVVANP